MILRNKWIFSGFVRIISIFIVIGIALFVFFYVKEDKSSESNRLIVGLTLGMFSIIALFLGLGRANMKIDPDNGQMSIKMGILGLTIFREEKKIPSQIQKLRVRKKKKAFGKSGPRDTAYDASFSYEILLIGSNNRPIRILTLSDERDYNLIDEIAALYRVEVEIISVKR